MTIVNIVQLHLAYKRYCLPVIYFINVIAYRLFTLYSDASFQLKLLPKISFGVNHIACLDKFFNVVRPVCPFRRRSVKREEIIKVAAFYRSVRRWRERRRKAGSDLERLEEPLPIVCLFARTGMDERIGIPSDGWLYGRTDRRIDRRTVGRKDGGIDGPTDERTDG